MRLKLTLLLVLLNCALFSFIFISERVAKSRTIDGESRLIIDPGFAAQIDSIEVISESRPANWAISKNADTWEVRQPFQWRANPYAVQQLLFHLSSLSWDSRFTTDSIEAAGQSLSDYNLLNPPVTLELTSGNRKQTLYLGSPTEFGNRLYLLTEDRSTVFVVNHDLLRQFSGSWESLLDRRIFSLYREQTRAIQILDRTDSNVRVRVIRQGDKWRFVSPIEADANGNNVELLIENWQQWDIERFVIPEAGQVAAFDQAPLRLTFEGLSEQENLLLMPMPQQPGEPRRFIGKRGNYDAVFEVPADRIESLRIAQDELRERRILRDWARGWSSLQIRTSRDSTTIQRLENGPWQVLRTGDSGDLRTYPADIKRIEGIEQLLETLETVRFISEAPSNADIQRFGLDDPQRIIQIRMPDGRSLDLQLGNLHADTTLLYARTNRAASVFLLRPHILGDLPINALHYRDRTLHRLPSNQRAQRVALVERESGNELLSGDADGREAGIESSATLELLFSMAREIRVDRYHTQAFGDPMPDGRGRQIQWPYLIKVGIQPGNGSSDPQELLWYLSARAGGTTQYIGDPRSGLVGMLPASMVETLDPLLTDYPDPLPDPPASGAEE